MLLEDTVWANHNCIRVWGGGYHPDDCFFDICDELGFIVWQDFTYACVSYELDPDAFYWLSLPLFERNYDNPCLLYILLTPSRINC